MSYAGNWLKVKLRRALPHAPVFEVFRGAMNSEGQRDYWRERTAGRVSGTGGEAYDSRWNAKRAAYAHAARIDGATVVVLD